jgi:hypothetical protein
LPHSAALRLPSTKSQNISSLHSSFYLVTISTNPTA